MTETDEEVLLRLIQEVEEMKLESGSRPPSDSSTDEKQLQTLTPPLFSLTSELEKRSPRSPPDQIPERPKACRSKNCPRLQIPEEDPVTQDDEHDLLSSLGVGSKEELYGSRIRGGFFTCVVEGKYMRVLVKL
eukprot:TRINITY_DN13816_c0_g1_i1.p1 TRINITY_DN13816_c0_g1~~TRINITY_DN13816_c0_g1_i1.p1  ORF type:complete len:133 (-),score=33.07 TRINITY_DN13816_c0_g1_i1:25-423(-)